MDVNLLRMGLDWLRADVSECIQIIMKLFVVESCMFCYVLYT